MQLHQIQPKHRTQKKHRVGRGGKKGAYSGKGVKGQRARAGARFKPIIRELIKRYPKRKGYRTTGSSLRFQVVQLRTVEKAFSAKEVVSPQSLLAKRLVSQGEGSRVKILGNEEIKKALVIEGCAVSKNAKVHIEKAGGAVKS